MLCVVVVQGNLKTERALDGPSLPEIDEEDDEDEEDDDGENDTQSPSSNQDKYLYCYY